MSAEQTIKQGENLPLRYSLTKKNPDTGVVENVDLSAGWVCRVLVKSQPGATSNILDKNLTNLSTDNFSFIGQLDDAETANFSVGDWWVVAELSEAASKQNKEIHQLITVEPQGVF